MRCDVSFRFVDQSLLFALSRSRRTISHSNSSSLAMAKAQSTPTKAASAPSLKPSALAQDVTSPSLDALVLEQEQLGSDSSRSWKETVSGEEGTTRRTLSTFASAFTIATLVRSLCFSRLCVAFDSILLFFTAWAITDSFTTLIVSLGSFS